MRKDNTAATEAPPFDPRIKGYEDGARKKHSARTLLKHVVRAVNAHLIAQGSPASIELESEDIKTTALVNIFTGSETFQLFCRISGDSVLTVEGEAVFLAGPDGPKRLGDAILARVACFCAQSAQAAE